MAQHQDDDDVVEEYSYFKDTANRLVSTDISQIEPLLQYEGTSIEDLKWLINLLNRVKNLTLARLAILTT